LIWLKFSDLIT